MIRQQTQHKPVGDRPEPSHTSFTPGLLIVKFKADVVRRSPKLSKRAMALMDDIEPAVVPESVTAPLEHLAREEHLVEVIPLFPGTTRAETLNKPGILSAVPLFPGEDDEDLSTIYVVEIGSKDASPVVERLENDPQVEYVERPPVRKLVRSTSR